MIVCGAKICGTCLWSKRDWTNKYNKDYYCSNEASENYGYNCLYADRCDEWEERTERNE